MKPLAVIGQIVDKQDIEGADFIKLFTVNCGDSGTWKGVSGNELNISDKVTVFLQDAILPPSDRWAFMEKHNWRVRMCRFKGVPSECLIVKGAPEMDVGIDLTEVLRVTKYEKVIKGNLAGEALGNFPSFIPKTDETNFQTYGMDKITQWLTADRWAVTEKLDGSSGTAYVDEDGQLHVCSRNLELREFSNLGKTNVYWESARKFKLDKLPHGVALQFEVVGPGIQKNCLKLKSVELRAFRAYDFKNHKRLQYFDFFKLCGDLEIPTANKIFTGVRSALSAEELQKMANFKHESGVVAEGIVVRDIENKWSFKVINLDFRD